ncbi:hypothetical protein ABXS69_08475 [Actinomyces timonensis]|uniref:Uncharacterized protein n=1 Tax=Actinomyces timonensis TaxID=1288391 RepID=A0AAU8N1Q9_9ACTO
MEYVERTAIRRFSLGDDVDMLTGPVEDGEPHGNAVEQRSLDLWALASDAFERRMRALSENEASSFGAGYIGKIGDER